jgi:hypothetical protein
MSHVASSYAASLKSRNSASACAAVVQIGSLGLSNVGATDVLLYGNIRGFRVVAITPQTGQDGEASSSDSDGITEQFIVGRRSAMESS